MEAAFFMAKYTDSDRLMKLESRSLEALSDLLKSVPQGTKRSPIKRENISSGELGPEDVAQITDLYREVFLSYPFPIHNPGYILKTMKANVRYFGAS
jgi:hypothetical protein